MIQTKRSQHCFSTSKRLSSSKHLSTSQKMRLSKRSLYRTFVAQLILVLSAISLSHPALADYTNVWSHEQALANLDNPDVLILDVRSPAEFQQGHVPGAINIPFDQLARPHAALSGWKDKEVVLYCRSGRRASIAENILEKQGYTQRTHLKGDMQAWEAAGLKTEKP